MGKRYADFSPQEKIAHCQRVLRWRRANPDKVKAWEDGQRSKRPKKVRGAPRVYRTDEEVIRKNKTAHYKAMGITLSLVERMLESQGGKCAICERELDVLHQNISLKCPNVDHCHTTMKIRGVLCRPCNQWLGLYESNKPFLAQSDTYLANRPSWGELKKSR